MIAGAHSSISWARRASAHSIRSLETVMSEQQKFRFPNFATGRLRPSGTPIVSRLRYQPAACQGNFRGLLLSPATFDSTETGSLATQSDTNSTTTSFFFDNACSAFLDPSHNYQHSSVSPIPSYDSRRNPIHPPPPHRHPRRCLSQVCPTRA